MSLKAFHILFVSVSFLLAVGCGVWFLRSKDEPGAGGYAALGWASLAASIVLVAYAIWFVRKLRRWNDDAARRKTNPLPGPDRGPGRGAGPGGRAGV
jgi:hypothetical protein